VCVRLLSYRRSAVLRLPIPVPLPHPWEAKPRAAARTNSPSVAVRGASEGARATRVELWSPVLTSQTVSVSGATSRQLVVPHCWGTRLGVWTRPPETGPLGASTQHAGCCGRRCAGGDPGGHARGQAGAAEQAAGEKRTPRTKPCVGVRLAFTPRRSPLLRVRGRAETRFFGMMPRAAATQLPSLSLAHVPSTSPCRTAMKKLRIVILGFGTARQKMALERWTNPKPL
jgi:hypothetical protein